MHLEEGSFGRTLLIRKGHPWRSRRSGRSDPALHEMVPLVPPVVILRHQACGKEAESLEGFEGAMAIIAFPHRGDITR